MDDIRIICKDKFQARKILKELIIELRRLHLNVNPKKTHMLIPSDDGTYYNEIMPKQNRLIEEIDSLFKQRNCQEGRP